MREGNPCRRDKRCYVNKLPYRSSDAPFDLNSVISFRHLDVTGCEIGSGNSACSVPIDMGADSFTSAQSFLLHDGH